MADKKDLSEWVAANRPDDFFRWSEPNELSARLNDRGERALVLAWSAPTSSADAILGDTAGQLAIHQLCMRTSAAEWPQRLRRLPPAGTLADALLSTFSEAGEYAVAWLRCDSRVPASVSVDTVNDVIEGNARPPESFSTRRPGRPKKGKGPTVEELLIATQMRDENRPTKEIIEKLMARGLSRQAAFRRLRLAESPRGADMILKHRDGSSIVTEIKTEPRGDS